MARVSAFALDFNRDVRPILSDKCFSCHGPDGKARKAKLRLDIKEGTLDGGAVIVAGKSSESELIRRIHATDPDERMPPPESNLSLTPVERQVLTDWVDGGAVWGEHWAFSPPRRAALPEVGGLLGSEYGGWARNGVDCFILSRLEEEQLTPSAEAEKETLIRRVTLDLTGLPPTPSEVDAFLADDSDDAYENLVDGLLASPRYGERMVWEWLDAARYAGSDGYQGDSERTMWPWRDWVVAAMNAGMPFDQFTVEQLAGDLLPGATHSQKLATAFNRNHMINGEGGRIAEENRVEYGFDQTETMATIWLGLTVGCARCHDHKFDPITQREYYELFAFFNNTPVDGSKGGGSAPPILESVTPEIQARKKELKAVIAEIAKEVRAYELIRYPRPEGQRTNESDLARKELPRRIYENLRRWPDERKATNLVSVVDYFKDRDPIYGPMITRLHRAIQVRDDYWNSAAPRVMVMDEREKPRETFVLFRGTYSKPLDKVSAALPEALPPMPPGLPANRLGLAQWLVDPSHPLTARVTVNRYWQLLFGTGLVKTVQDFGVQGEKPLYPELLDWLAVEFVESGWDSKRLFRLLLTSATYRQTSKATAELHERDPENRFLARGPRYRLPSFMIRDQALVLGGLLSGRVGGLPCNPYQPPGVWEEASFGKKRYVQDHGEKLYRRSLYTFWRRIVAPTMFFDAASRQTCSVQTTRTNTPLHALAAMNDRTYIEAARVMAERLLQRADLTTEGRIASAFRQVTARYPSAEERGILSSRVQRLVEQYTEDPRAARELLAVGESPRDVRLDPIPHAALTTVCSLMMNLDEAITKE